MQWRSAQFLLGLMLTIVPLSSAWPKSSGYELGQAERVRSLAWIGADALLLLAETKDGYGLRRLDLQSGDLDIVASPRSFTLLKPAQSEVQLHLSPRGRWILSTETPREHAEIRLWRVTGDQIEDVPLRLPQNVVPGTVCWSEDDGQLYLGAAPYLYPDQEYSILRLDLAKGELSGIAIKGNIDNISQLAFAPGAKRLVAICGGFRGEYPLQPVAVRVELGNSEMALLHSECRGMQLSAMGDGSVLLCRDSGLGLKGEAWVLPVQGCSLVPAATQCSPQSLLSSNKDGSWLGWLDGTKAGRGRLLLQAVADSTVLEGPEDCSAFSFSPVSPLVVAILDGGRALSVMDLER